MAFPTSGSIFGAFGGGTPSNTLQFSPGLQPGQIVPSSSAFNPTPILNAFFQPFPYAANSLMTSTQIALSGGGPPLIASYPTLSPFSNSFLNLFNPAATPGLGGLVPGAGGTQQGATAPANAGGALSGLSGLSTLLRSLGL